MDPGVSVQGRCTLPTRPPVAASLRGAASPRPRSGHGVTIVLAGIVLALMAISLALHGFGGDLLMDINIGQWIVAHGHVPLHNYFTQALYGHPFSDTEWGFAVYVAEAYRLGGRMGVYVSCLPFLAVVAGFVGDWARRAGPRWGLLVALLAGLALTIASSPRPQLVSYAAFAFGLWAIQHARHGRWFGLLGFVAVIPLWANMHSSVILAPALLFNEALWGRGRYRWSMALATLTGTALMLVRVGGAAAGGGFMAHVLSSGVVNVIQEWQSPNFHVETGIVLLPAIFAAWAICLPRAWQQRQWPSSAWLVVGPLVTLWAIRFAPYMILGTAACVPDVLPSPRAVSPSSGFRAVAVVIALGFTALWTTVPLRGKFFAPTYPVAAFRYLQRQHAQGVVVFQNWSDAAEFAHLLPWINGQAQLWAATPCWIPFVQAQGSAQAAMAWAHRWDPAAHWLLWPMRATPENRFPVPGWRLVYQARTPQGRVGVWEQRGKR